jgi:hypothetical protein
MNLVKELLALRENADQLYSLELDWGNDKTNTEEKVLADVKKISGSLHKMEVLTMRGPGGGWPVVRVVGTQAELKNLLKAYCDGDEIEIADFLDMAEPFNE